MTRNGVERLHKQKNSTPNGEHQSQGLGDVDSGPNSNWEEIQPVKFESQDLETVCRVFHSWETAQTQNNAYMSDNINAKGV